VRNGLFVPDFLLDFYTVRGISALLPVLMGAGHGLRILISRKTDSVELSCARQRLAVNGSTVSAIDGISLIKIAINSFEKNVQTDPLSKRLAPPSGQFSAITPDFFAGSPLALSSSTKL